MNVKICKLHPNAIIPQYASPLAAGFDLVAVEDVVIAPGETKLVKTGLAFEVLPGYEMQIRPRSGVTLKTKLRVGNSPGTVDADFRGEVAVIVDNTAEFTLRVVPYPLTIGGELEKSVSGVYEQHTYIIRKGDRIAQGIIAPVQHVEFTVVDELSVTERGDGGFGSTGV